MLDLMRTHAQSWIIKVALGGIAIVFVFFFGWSGRGEKSQTYLAKVNGTVISYDEFHNFYETELEQIRMQGSLPPELLEKLHLKKKVAHDLIVRILVRQEAERLGLFVTDEDLLRVIHADPAFQRDGLFDPQLYKIRLRTIRMTPATYEDMRRQALLGQQLQQLLSDGVEADPDEIKKLWHFHNDKLVLSMALIKPQDAKTEAPPDPKVLEVFFKEHEKNYEIPPSLNLQYVAFSWKDVKDKISVSPEEVKNYYDMNPKEFSTPERLKVSHILVAVPPDADKEKLDQLHKQAEEILAKIKAGEDFAKLAAEFSQDAATAKQGGDLGTFSRGTMDPGLEQAAAKLQVGQISDPVLTHDGWHLLKLDEKKPAALQEFELVKDKIAQKLIEESAKKLVNAQSQEFYEQVYRSEDLDIPAKKFGIQVRTAEAVKKDRGLPDLGPDRKLMDEAFGLKLGEISRLMKKDDTYVVMKLIERIKERIPTLDEVRSTVQSDYLREHALADATKKAEQFLEALNKQPSAPDEVAKEFGLTWEKLDAVSRTTGLVPQLGGSPDVTAMLTTISTSSPVFPKPIVTTPGVAVVRLVKVDQASDEEYAKEARAFEGWIKEVRKTEFLKGWIKVLETKAKIDINDKLL